VKEAWVAGPVKKRRERAPRRRIDWKLMLFFVIYIGVGLALMWGVFMLITGDTQ